MICRVRSENELTNSLCDCLFLVNNVIFEVIAIGKSVYFPIEEEPYQELTNSVGGYVTLQIMQRKSLHYPNNLFLHYQRDINTFLDKVTFPFSETVFLNKEINYNI